MLSSDTYKSDPNKSLDFKVKWNLESLTSFDFMALFNVLELSLDDVVHQLISTVEVKNAEVFYFDTDDHIPGVSVVLS